MDFVHDTGPSGGYRMPEIMGSGCALFDFDNDGRLDVYLVQNGGPGGPRNQLLHQETDGTFKNVSVGSGVDVAGWGMGVAVADVNNDGYPDLLLTEYGRLRLFLNHGDGTFQDVTVEAGLEGADSSEGAIGPPHADSTRGPLPWYTSAAFFDYDRDGWLDLVVTQYVAYDPGRVCTDEHGRLDYCGPSLFPGLVTRIFYNLGTSRHSTSKASAIPHFEDVTARSGLSAAPGPGLGVICRDFDGDGWPDILVANDGKPNQLWINRHDATFVDEAASRGLSASALGQVQANMGIAVGDVNGDGRFDVFIPHLTEEPGALWMQTRRGFFAESAAARGLASRGATGFGAVLADFTNTGSLGLAVANGRVVRPAPSATFDTASTSLAPYWRPYAERNALFANDGTGHFHDLSSSNPDFCAIPNVGRALAQGDIDNDGGVDLLLTTAGGEARLLRNVAAGRGHWLLVRDRPVSRRPRCHRRDSYRRGRGAPARRLGGYGGKLPQRQ